MRILLLFPMADGQTGLAIQRAFENLDHEVLAVDAKLNWEKERKKVAERGYKWVHANATYTHRIKTALDYIKAN